MDKETHIRAGVINRNFTTTLRGIIRIDNEWRYRHDGTPEANGVYRIHVYSNMLDFSIITVQYDSNKTLKFTQSGLAKNKKAFEGICSTLYHDDDVEIKSAGDAYKQRTWQVIQKCVAAHVKAGGSFSVFDIVKDLNEDGVEINPVRVLGEKKVKIELNDEFLYVHGSIKFRVHCTIEDEARNVCFAGIYLVEASSGYCLSPAYYDTEFIFSHLAFVSPRAMRKAIMDALESETREATIQGEFGKYGSVPMSDRLMNAKAGYKLIMEHFHNSMLEKIA